MSFESKRDLVAAISIGLMFAGAFMLTFTPLGFGLMAAGAFAMLALLTMSARRG